MKLAQDPTISFAPPGAPAAGAYLNGEHQWWQTGPLRLPNMRTLPERNAFAGPLGSTRIVDMTQFFTGAPT
jgi:hypothetical protein